MNVGWFILVVFCFILGCWVVDFSRRKARRKILVKAWVNFTISATGFLTVVIISNALLTSIVAVGSIVSNSWYSGMDWSVIAFMMIAEKVLPWIGLLSVIGILEYLFAWVLSVNKRPNLLAVWKYSPEELKYLRECKQAKKEKNRKRLPSRLFKILYPEKRAPKYPRLDKFLSFPFISDKED